MSEIKDLILDIGSYGGIAAFIGLAVMAMLYFSQARDVRRLREWAGRAPERDAQVQQLAGQYASQAVSEALDSYAQMQEQAVVEQPQLAVVDPETPVDDLAEHPQLAPDEELAAAEQQMTSENVAVEVGDQVGQQNGDGTSEELAQGDVASVPQDDEQTADHVPGSEGEPPPAMPPDAGDGESIELEPAEGELAASAAADHARSVTEVSGASVNSAPPLPPRGPSTPAAIYSASARATPSAGDSPPPMPPPPMAPSPEGPPSYFDATGEFHQVGLPPRRRSTGGGSNFARRFSIALAGLVVIVAVIGGAVTIFGGSETATKPRPRAVTPGTNPQVNRPAVRVTVLNGTTVGGLASIVGEQVDGAGFQLGVVTNAPRQDHLKSVVYYQSGAKLEAQEVAKELAISRVTQIDDVTQAADPQAQVIVIAGLDIEN